MRAGGDWKECDEGGGNWTKQRDDEPDLKRIYWIGHGHVARTW